MTILNNYSQLYWLTRLDGLKAMFLTISVLSGIALGLTILFSIIMADIESEETIANVKKIRNYSILPFIISFIFATLLPTKNEMIFIYAGGKTMDFIDSDTSINKIPAQTTKIITDYLEKQIKETNEDGRNK